MYFGEQSMRTDVDLLPQQLPRVQLRYAKMPTGVATYFECKISVGVGLFQRVLNLLQGHFRNSVNTSAGSIDQPREHLTRRAFRVALAGYRCKVAQRWHPTTYPRNIHVTRDRG